MPSAIASAEAANVHPGEELVDHLYLGAHSRCVAEPVRPWRRSRPARHRLHEPSFVPEAMIEIRPLAARAPRRIPERRSSRTPFGVQPLAEIDGEFRRDRAAGDDHRAACKSACAPSLPKSTSLVWSA